MKPLRRLEVVREERIEGGWMKIARRTLRNHYADGTRSEPFHADAAWRPGIDAVAVLAWRRGADGVEVLLRRFLRPGIDLRGRLDPPTQDALHPVPMIWELSAGVPEADEYAAEGFPRCGARELEEEMGLRVAASDLRPLGAGIYPSPGILTEMIHLFEVEVPPSADLHPVEGDGSAFEEAGELRWWGLAEALAACDAGELADAKTEVALRRLEARLRG